MNDEFRDVERRLEDAKPALSALELDAAKLRIMQSAPQRQTGLLARKKGNLMKSRVALVAVLALGVFMSGTGATLAVSGFANDGSASSAQYQKTNNHSSKGHHVVEAAKTSGGSNCAEGTSGAGAGGNSANSGSKNCTEPAAVEPAAVEAQAVEQVAVNGSSSSLPFTGFLAIPVLIVGLGLLGAGVAMRVRTRRGDHLA
jgi:cobalamin biosynthesis Mg chelatase CobN